MSSTPNLRLPYLDANQNQKTVTHNAALTALDALVNCQVGSAALAAPPAAPADGQCWIVASGGTGAWAGRDGVVAAWQDGAWNFYAPNKGTLAYDDATTTLLAWTGAAWVPALGAVGQMQLSALGVGTAPDGGNPLSATLNAALFNAVAPGAGGTGDVRVKLNKAGAANTASLLFQDGFSGRAEIGLAGDDNFHLKVSPDGATFYDALDIAAAGGAVSFGGSPTAPTPAAADNSTRLATTAYVQAQGFLTAGAAASAAPVQSVAGRSGAVTLAVADVAGAAPVASPAFTGTPTAPNPAAGTNSAQVATTSFVAASFVTYGYASATYATAASPTLTGTPAAPTAAPNSNSTQLATTAYADRAAAASNLARTQVNDAAYAIQPGDRVVAVIALTAARTLTLPVASTYPPGATLTVVDESGACSATSTITLVPAGSDKINGAASAVIANANGYLALESNGSGKWTVVDGNPTGLGRQAANAAAITGGTIDGTTVGGSAPAPGVFTGLSATGSLTVQGGTAIVTTAATAGIEHGSTTTAGTPYMDWHSSGASNDFDVRIIASGGTAGNNGTGSLSFTGASFAFQGTLSVGANQFAANNVAVGGGTINGTVIGGSTQAAGAFTTLTGSGTATFQGAVTVGGVLSISAASADGAGGINKVNLFGGVYGFGISAGSLDYVTNGAHSFFWGSTLLGQFTSTGLNGMPIGATTPAPARVTTLGTSGTIASTLAPQSGWALDTAGNAQSLAQGASLALAAGSGLLVVSNLANADVGLFLVSGGSVTLVSNPGGTIVASASPGSGKVGVFYGGNAYAIANNYGSTVQVGAMLLRTRASN